MYIHDLHATEAKSKHTMRIFTQALVYSAMEYCAPVWWRSTHAMQETLHSTKWRHAYGILLPAIIPRQLTAFPIMNRNHGNKGEKKQSSCTVSHETPLSEDHLLHHIITHNPQCAHLKSRRPFAYTPTISHVSYKPTFRIKLMMH